MLKLRSLIFFLAINFIFLKLTEEKAASVKNESEALDNKYLNYFNKNLHLFIINIIV